MNNLNYMVFENFSNGPNIGFCSLQKQPHHIGFWKNFKNDINISFLSLWK
jgi:hypothetical protein